MSLTSDRAVFLQSLQRNPLVLVRHLPCLGAALFNKIANRFRSATQTFHRGAKRSPHWIKSSPHQRKLPVVQEHDIFLPNWNLQFDAVAVPETKSAIYSVQLEAGDMEAYFEANRWGFLCQQLWDPSVSRHSALAAIRSWIAQNPNRDSEAWEPYSASERIANLLVWLACNGLPDDEADAKNLDLKLFVGESLKWIADHLEYYGENGTNNHILNNARALVMGGVALGDEHSFQVGMKTLRFFLPRLLASAGFLRERSSHYQLIVTNWVLDAWYFVHACLGESDPDVIFLKDYAQRMTTATTLLCDERGELLGLIGDVSPDSPPAMSLRRLRWLYSSTLQGCRKPRVAGLEIADDWFLLRYEGQSVLGNFPAGQFPPSFPTHGHGDHTGFVWRAGAVTILADSGRYRYTADSVSTMQRSALGHSIPFVNGFAPLCESILQNGLWWPRPYATTRLFLAACESGVRMSHDGFARATPVNHHMRQIVITSGGIEVGDTFKGQGSVALKLRWNFGAEFDSFDAESCCVSGPDTQVRLHITGFDGAPTFRVCCQDQAGGWYSEAYAVKTASITLDVEGQVLLTASIKTRFEIIDVRNSRNT